MRNQVLSMTMLATLLSAAFLSAAEHYCDDPPALTVLTGEEVLASGLSSEGHPAEYSWYITPPDEPVPVEPTSTDPTYMLTLTSPGSWSVALQTDYLHQAPLGGLWSSETCVTIQVSSVVAAITTASLQVPTDEDLLVTGYDSRWGPGVIPDVEWLVDDAPLGSCNGGPPPSGPGDLSCTIPGDWLEPGWHTAGLRLTDPASGQSSLAVADFEVIEVIPLSVELSWSPVEPDPGDSVVFTATVTPVTDEADFTEVTWDTGDGNGIVYSSCPPPYFYTCLIWPYTYSTDGWYDVTVTVETLEESASATVTVEIGDPVASPTAAIGATPSTPLIYETTALTFEGSCTGDCLWYWDFDDGTQSTLENPTHSWNVPATYSVGLTVSNQTGSDSAILPLTVSSCWSPTTPSQEGACFGGPVTLTADSGSAWAWNTGAGTQVIPALFEGLYWVNVNDGSGCWGYSPATVVLDNCGDPDGDTNLDGSVDAADLAALVPELTDGDGDSVVDAGGGDLTAPGGDVTGDFHLRADDVLTALLELFGE